MARILWIEDDPDVRIVVENVLLAEGHTVDAAATVAGGLALLETHEYDLLLTDGRLPDGTGIDLAHEAESQGAAVLIITAYAFILSELTANPGRFSVLLKPVRPDELVEAINQALSQSK
jgi:DNA-binding NtrC family response regulator